MNSAPLKRTLCVYFIVLQLCCANIVLTSWLDPDQDYDFDDEIEHEIPCSPPGQIANGETVVWGDGLLLEYRCKPGYFPVGITHGACDLATGTWTIDPIVCADKGCSELSPPSNGVVNIDSSGGLATIHCRSGFFLIGDETLVCEERQWKGIFPICAVTAKPNEKTKSRKDIDTTVVKGSSPDYSLEESDETCFYNQISPPEIEYAVLDTSYLLNEVRQRYVMVATYTCMGGYKLRDSKANQLFCKNLVWSAPQLPKCIVEDDPCELDNGGCHHYCTPTASNVHACSCYEGYNLASDARICKDADECAIDNGGCQQECFNTEGSFFCSCLVGYKPDGPKCLDIDECAKTENQCPGPCVNLPGTFMCDCNITGYAASEALNHCKDIDECADHNGGCDDVCINRLGSYECRCEAKGRKLGDDGHSCVDVDECARYKSKVCAHGTCINTEGSYICACDTGYTQANNRSSCEDTDECEFDNGSCQQVCINNGGSFQCACHQGYVINDDERSCTDIDECAHKNGGCEDQCINNEGSFSCSCTHAGKVLASDGLTCTGCNRTQYFNLTMSSCMDCPDHAHSRDGLALTVNDCLCDEGFHGNPALEVECQDTNECHTSEKICSHECVNIIGSFYCACPEGLSVEKDGVTCQDIDECQQSIHNCSQLCQNTYGTYSCSCHEGYLMDLDGLTCTDIDECELRIADCSDGCTNTEGSYTCGCVEGYRLDDKGRACEDINECLQDISPCQHVCSNTEGSFVCECNGPGYKLSRDGSSCIDINECMEGDNPCPDICINTVGSFLCDCDKPGYLLAGDASGCEDINECSADPSPCPYQCLNTPGSYRCSCPPGHADPPEHNQTLCVECPHGTYRGPGDTKCRRCPPRSNSTKTGSTSIKDCICLPGYLTDPAGSGLCLDINECKTGVLRCEQGCVDVEGSAYCVCRPGFKLNEDKITCSDKDECESQNGGCEQVCINTPGSFRCKCQGRGYRLADNGLSCIDVDECQLPGFGCEFKCVNTKDGAQCVCPEGYELLPDGKKCQDVNECLARNGGCTDLCVNTEGSYKCECSNLPGYKLYTDGRQCTDINECEELEQACDDLCVNNVGSFRCHCRQRGFQLGEDKRSCVDIDECMRSRLCEQRCINLPGSFRCDCHAGYFKRDRYCSPCAKGSYRGLDDSVVSCQVCPPGMTTNGTTTASVKGCFCPAGYYGRPELGENCRDIDECSNAELGGRCEQECVNTNGSYHCACREGYVLNPDNTTCTPTKCPILLAPQFAKFLSYECQRMRRGDHVTPGTVCEYKCRGALVLLGDRERTCLANFTWTGEDPTCKAFPCERLEIPENGYLHPPGCMLPRIPFRTRCSFRCNKGFKRVGRAGSKCKANRKWSGKGIPKCVPK